MKDDAKLFFFLKPRMTVTCNTANIEPVFLVGFLFYPTDCKQKMNCFFFWRAVHFVYHIVHFDKYSLTNSPLK